MSTHLTVGAVAHGMIGAFALPGGGTIGIDANVGVAGAVGTASIISILFGALTGYRAVDIAYDSGGGIIDTHTSGSGSYRYTRLQAGLQVCMGAETVRAYCELGLDLVASIDRPDYTDQSSVTISARMWQSRNFFIQAEAGRGYPNAGRTTRSVMPDNESGWILELGFGFSTDEFTPWHNAEVTSDSTTKIP